MEYPGSNSSATSLELECNHTQPFTRTRQLANYACSLNPSEPTIGLDDFLAYYTPVHINEENNEKETSSVLETNKKVEVTMSLGLSVSSVLKQI
ncbi:hypothetical protein D9619_009118 [Psilocybe cf. subviscida]|uniref:Uncharacterized protein n=1 Tax=Psilocybe cf. subviscida TaxID=2480587 RepID=A0A8H5BUD4_9AGAR|nr:hypothetical protein D9619_009118 [Psilocybe cf. subviscida]